MISELGSISVLSILVAAVASFLLGGAWFAGLFPELYAVALGREHSPKVKPAAIFLVGPFLCGVITTATSALLIHALKIQSLDDAVMFGAVVGFGFMASTAVNTAINPNIPFPILYGLISGSYFFISSIAVSLILVAMQ